MARPDPELRTLEAGLLRTEDRLLRELPGAPDGTTGGRLACGEERYSAYREPRPPGLETTLMRDHPHKRPP